MLSHTVRPTQIRIDACSACQLHCRLCPVHSSDAPNSVGIGFLRFENFRRLIEANPWVESVELGNYGEAFLNPELPQILRFAHERGVVLRLEDGANLNTVSDELLEAVVKYRLRSIRCSIDGASNETYSIYRVGGNFDAVIGNLRRLNALKAKYQSELPALHWQFIAFGHNEHEIPKARALAEELGMTFGLKLSWDSDFSPVANQALLRSELGAASRE